MATRPYSPVHFGSIDTVASGAASAGLAFASDAQQSRDYGILFRVPRAKAETEYVAAILAGGRRRDEARELLEFLETPRAARCLRRFGFRPAGALGIRSPFEAPPEAFLAMELSPGQSLANVLRREGALLSLIHI